MIEQAQPVPAGALVYQGEIIHDRGDMLSLTDMWKAGGSPENREPFNWARFEGKPFIEAVALSHNLSDAQVLAEKRGKGGANCRRHRASSSTSPILSENPMLSGQGVVGTGPPSPTGRPGIAGGREQPEVISGGFESQFPFPFT